MCKRAGVRAARIIIDISAWGEECSMKTGCTGNEGAEAAWCGGEAYVRMYTRN